MKKLQRAMSAARRGFTLVELLVVIGILAILTAVVLVAVNPARQLQQARNTQRRADINAILTSISTYMADPVNRGNLPPSITGASACTTPLTAGADRIGIAVGNLNLAADVAPLYIAALPFDPTIGDGTANPSPNTGYDVCIADVTSRRITVSAPGSVADGEASVISVTR